MNQLRLPRWANVTSLGHSPELHCKWSESTSLSQSENFTNTKLNKLKSKQKCSFIANEHFFYPKIQDKQKKREPDKSGSHSRASSAHASSILFFCSYNSLNKHRDKKNNEYTSCYKDAYISNTMVFVYYL